ncbi:MAG TPA: transglycosylase SLT domain-containing protein, partial [Rhodopila sp.]|uniref:lytic transglycosylase domain-containing protein n=1 Tax=Rhodopila sp. TaxID=2480087 RepID=UPI002D10A348
MPYPFATWLRLIACLALLSALAACGGSHSTRHAAVPRSPSRYYPPPGPKSDPWGPYIREASARFGLPEKWIRGVMHQESGGQEDVISWAGAIGLMQVMPDTYAEMRDRYGLGNDPFDPHNNILAGTAYLREMYDRFGSPGFLAAYNAGPNREDKYLNYGQPLPTETVQYVAAIAPHLGSDQPTPSPFEGRGVEVASGGFQATPAIQRAPTPASCDPDAAYDPNAPCKPAEAPVLTASLPARPLVTPQLQTAMAVPPPVPMAQAASSSGLGPSVQSALARIESEPPRQPVQQVALAPPAPAWTSTPRRYNPPPAQRYAYASPPPPEVPCDPDAAYDPNRRCVYTAQPYTQVASRAIPYEPPPPPRRPVLASATLPEIRGGGVTAAAPPGRWAIQVGAYPTLPGAQSAAERA